MIRMAAVQVVSGLVSMAFLNNFRKVFAGKANGRTKVCHVSAACPVAQTNRYSVGIILFKASYILLVLYYIRSQFFFISCVQMWYCIQGSQKNESNVTVKCRP